MVTSRNFLDTAMLVLAASIPLMTSGTLLQHGTGVLSQVSTWHPVLMTFGIGFMITLGVRSGGEGPAAGRH